MYRDFTVTLQDCSVGETNLGNNSDWKKMWAHFVISLSSSVVAFILKPIISFCYFGRFCFELLHHKKLSMQSKTKCTHLYKTDLWESLPRKDALGTRWSSIICNAAMRDNCSLQRWEHSDPRTSESAMTVVSLQTAGGLQLGVFILMVESYFHNEKLKTEMC